MTEKEKKFLSDISNSIDLIENFTKRTEILLGLNDDSLLRYAALELRLAIEK